MVFASLVVGLLPVMLFLAALGLLDSFKLTRRNHVMRSIGAGAGAALAAWGANFALLHGGAADPVIVRRYVAPVIEELLKGAIVVYLVRGQKVGFMVDAAIHGFAIGTGFALVENVYYAWALHTFSLALWVVRGLGTAMLHGATTAIVAIVSRDLTERHDSVALRWFLPGLALAILVHSLYNHLLLNPLLSSALLLFVMPVLLIAVFERSERATRDWLGTGLDGDAERLEQILDGEVERTPVGLYLDTLKHRFHGAVLADMLCLLRIHLELSLRAKGVLIARAAGIDLPPDPEIQANFVELRYLEKTIGPIGRLALQPMLRTSSRDLWQIHMLKQAHGETTGRLGEESKTR